MTQNTRTPQKPRTDQKAKPQTADHGLTAPRTVIRERVREILVAGLPAWDTRVTPERIKSSRATPLSPKRLPAVLIYTRDEKLDKEAHADPGLRHRVLELAVEVVGGGDDPQPDTTVDLLAVAVESLIDAHETIGGLVEGTRLARIDTEIDGEGDAVYVASRLLFEITYWTRSLFLDASGLPEHLEEVSGDRPESPDGPDNPGGQPAPLIPGMTDRLGDEPDVPRPKTVLVSFSPHIGIPHEPDYRPLGDALERPLPPCQGHD